MPIAQDGALFTGIAIAQEIQPQQHDARCQAVSWVTLTNLEDKGFSEEQEENYREILDEEDAVCHNCGVESKVNSTERTENVVLDKAGAEGITDGLGGGTTPSFNRMKLGSTTSPGSPTKSQTQLDNTVTTSPSLTPSQFSTGGAEVGVSWTNTFASSTGRSNIRSVGMDTGTATGTNANLLNRATFTTAKDNDSNDLNVTYKLKVNR